MKLIIYPGLQKTGTSYFQLFCRSNQSLLKESCKISYLNLEEIFPYWPKSEKYSSNHNKIASHFADYSSSFKPITRDELQILEKTIIDTLEEHHVLLCAEDFSRQVNLQSLSNFCTKILDKTTAELMISFVLRKPQIWAQSMFNQYNKQRLLNFIQDKKPIGELILTTHGMAGFLKQQGYFRLLNQANLIAYWEKNFINGKIEILSYEKVCTSEYSLPIEILTRLIPDLKEKLRDIENQLIIPSKANTNISNNWLKILFEIASDGESNYDTSCAIRKIIDNNNRNLINLSGATNLKGIESIDNDSFNIIDYFKAG